MELYKLHCAWNFTAYFARIHISKIILFPFLEIFCNKFKTIRSKSLLKVTNIPSVQLLLCRPYLICGNNVV